MFNNKSKTSPSEKPVTIVDQPSCKKNKSGDAAAVGADQTRPTATDMQKNSPVKKQKSTCRKIFDFLLCRNCCKEVDDDEPYKPIPVSHPAATAEPVLPLSISLSELESKPVGSSLTSTIAKSDNEAAVKSISPVSTDLIIPTPKANPVLSSSQAQHFPSSTSAKSSPSPNTANEPAPSATTRVLTSAPPVLAPMSLVTRSPHNEEDDDEMWTNESADSSSVSSGDFDYEALYFKLFSELKLLKKESAAREQKMEAEWLETKTELQKTKEKAAELEITNQQLVAESNQLEKEKEKQRVDYTVSLANAVEDYKTALSEIQKLTSKNSALEESIAVETSWRESFRIQLEANKVITDDAISKLNIQIQQQAEMIDNLERQLTDSSVSENLLTEPVEDGLEEKWKEREKKWSRREKERTKREQERLKKQ